MPKKKILHIDVMLHDRFQCTIHYPYNPLFAIDHADLTAYILRKVPSLKNKPYMLHFNN